MKIGSYEIQVPFVTTSADHIKTVLDFADIQRDTTVIDLGSGDGRMVLEFAKKGAEVTGYEIKHELVERSRFRIKEAKLSERAIIHEKSFWDADLSLYNIIYLYGMNSIMGRLEEKFAREVKPRTKIISNVFHFRHLKLKQSKNEVNLYIYG